MTKLTFLNALPQYARQMALEEISQLLQAKYGQNYTLTEQDIAYGSTKPQQATQEEIDEVVKILM